MIGSKILFAYRKRLINVRLENYLEIISVFDIVFLSHIAYTINTTKNQKRGGVSMATSSITHNFVVSNPNSVKRFVAAIDEADRDRTPKQTLPGRQLTNPQEILALMSKRKKKTCLINIFTVNIRAYLDKDEPTYIGEESLYDLLSDFSCPKKSRCGILFYYIMRLSLPKKINLSLIWYLMLKMLHWLVIFHLQ